MLATIRASRDENFVRASSFVQSYCHGANAGFGVRREVHHSFRGGSEKIAASA